MQFVVQLFTLLYVINSTLMAAGSVSMIILTSFNKTVIDYHQIVFDDHMFSIHRLFLLIVLHDMPANAWTVIFVIVHFHMQHTSGVDIHRP